MKIQTENSAENLYKTVKEEPHTTRPTLKQEHAVFCDESLADHTARSYWRDNVVCLSLCPSVCL